MRDVLTFNGRSLSDFGVFFDLCETFTNPEKDYDIISIPGRNGSLSIYNNKFKDVTISVPCFVRENFLEKYRNLMEYLNSVTGFQRLESSKEPNYFRKALFIGSVEPKTGSFLKSGKFTLNFQCHPQRWLKQFEDWIDATSPGTYTWTIENPTNMASKPLLQFRGNGTISFYDSGHTPLATITVSNNANNYVEIDCETFDCYSESLLGIIVNRNADVLFNGDPELVIGENNVTYDTSYTGVEPVIQVMPRFFVI